MSRCTGSGAYRSSMLVHVVVVLSQSQQRCALLGPAGLKIRPLPVTSKSGTVLRYLANPKFRGDVDGADTVRQTIARRTTQPLKPASPRLAPTPPPEYST